MPEEQTQQPSSQLSSEKIDKQLNKLVQAIERTYGSTAHLMWRNFLAGFTRALGIIIGYVVIIAVIAFIAQKMGLLDPLKEMWNNITNLLSNLPTATGGQLKVDPELLEQFKNFRAQ